MDSFNSKDWGEGAGVSSHSGNLVLMKNTSHPNAARVFINWLLSRDGQMELQRVLKGVQDAESRRLDIPKDNVLPEIRWVDGVDYIEMDRNPDMRPVYKVVNKALAEAKKARR